MTHSQIWYAAWDALVAFAFLSFTLISQQGKASGRNTWAFKNKFILVILSLAGFIAAGMYLLLHHS